MSSDWKPLWQNIKQWHEAGRNIALATVVNTWGSSPRPTGSMMIVDDQGAVEGSVSGGCIEGAVITAALEAMGTGKPQLLDFDVSNDQAWEVGLSCGGRVRVLVEPIVEKLPFTDKILSATGPVILTTDCITGKTTFAYGDNNAGRSRLREAGEQVTFTQILEQPLTLIIIGAVHITQSMVRIAGALDIDVVVIDPRTTFASEARFPGIDLCVSWPDEALKDREITSGTAIVTLTHDPKLDDAALLVALNSPSFYIASLGSRKTHAARVERLTVFGMTAEQIGRIHAPAGLGIGAKTPAEIALSVMAQLISIYRNGDDR
ncbi:MAG: XdhC/CoxI family protein [Alphaproteobacteria bacterium]|nr:MAG: XdhC/CoxI family protein [Alphaproteobacteria bacterium]